MKSQPTWAIGALPLAVSLVIGSGQVGAAEIAPNVFTVGKLNKAFGGNVAAAVDINEQGIAVGTISDSVTDELPVATIWDLDGTPINATGNSSISSSGHGLNNLGHVVGNATGATLWADGQTIKLQATDPSAFARASDINDNGLIIGCESDPVQPGMPIRLNRPVQWAAGVVAEPIPGTPAGVEGCAYSVNALGHITGAATIDNQPRAVIWRDGQLVGLDIPTGFTSCIGYGINDFDHVAGVCTNATSMASRPFLWRDGEVINLGVLSGDTGIATDVNNAGEVVGYAPSAFVWRDGVLYDLQPVVGHKVNTLGKRAAINNTGQIVSGDIRLTPVPGGLDLALLPKSFPTSGLLVGDSVTYTGQVVNLSGHTAAGVVFTDILPSGLTVDSATVSQGSCTQSSPVVCTIGDLVSGGVVDFTLVATATGTNGNDSLQRLSVSAAENDVNPINDGFDFTVRIYPEPSADLRTIITATPDPAKRGRPLHLIAFAYNTGSVQPTGLTTATGVTLTLELPRSVTFQSLTPSQGQCGISGTTVTCDFGEVAHTKSANVDVLVTVSKRGGKLSSTATVNGDLPDPDLSNNTFTKTIAVVR